MSTLRNEPAPPPVRGSKRSALIDTTPSWFWTTPSMTSALAPTMARRWVSNRCGVTMALAKPVSSSTVMKTKPLAVPGRWRTMTTVSYTHLTLPTKA